MAELGKSTEVHFVVVLLARLLWIPISSGLYFF